MDSPTKKYKRLAIIFTILSTLLTFLPIIIVGITGCVNGTISIENKLKLNICFAVALFFTVLGVKSKYKCRSVIYIMIFGCFYVTQHMQSVVILCGVCCIVDEFMLQPLVKYFKSRYIINKEIDKRIN